MRRFFILLILAVAASFAATDTLQGQVHSSSAYRYLISKEEILRHLEFLTSEEIAGRVQSSCTKRGKRSKLAGKGNFLYRAVQEGDWRIFRPWQ